MSFLGFEYGDMIGDGLAVPRTAVPNNRTPWHFYLWAICERIRNWFRFQRWRARLTHGERVRLDYWGATGNPKHYDGCWRDQ